MYEWIDAGRDSAYMQCPARIGFYRSADKEVWLIDSGSSRDAAKKCRRLLAERELTARGILLTHSHADHVGGNALLQEQLGCRSYTTGAEALFTRFTQFEPSMLYGGYPHEALRHHILMARPSEAEELQPGILPEGLTALPLPGHSFDMVGFLTAGGTAFIGDSVASAATFEKYKISYLYDVQRTLDTLDALTRVEARLFVPAHAEVVEDIRPLVDINRDAILSVADHIEARCTEAIGFEDLLARLFEDYDLEMTIEQHALVGSTVRSFLSWLSDTGRLTWRIEKNHLLWQKAH